MYNPLWHIGKWNYIVATGGILDRCLKHHWGERDGKQLEKQVMLWYF